MKLDYSPKHLDFFIALGDTYENVKPIQAAENKDDNNRLYGTFRDDEKVEWIKKPISDYAKPFFPFFSKLRKHPDELDELYQSYRIIRTGIDDYLLRCDNFSARFSEIEKHLTDELGIEEEDAIIILKACAADTLVYKYKRLQSGEYLTFSSLKTQVENSLIYNSSLAEELKIKSDKISLLVSHSQTVGNYRELLLRDLLKKHIPSRFSVATGFIEGFSRQLDIIIYDSLNFSPLFIEGELVVIQQEAVRGVIEVKTTLNTTALFEALEMFHEISVPGFRRTKLPIFKGIFAFDSDYVNTSSISDCIYDFYNKPYYHEALKSDYTRGLLYLFHEISCVCVMKKHCVATQYNVLDNDASKNLLPLLLSISDRKGRDIQTAVFLSHLFDYLDVEYYGKKSSIWNFSRLASASTIIKMERKLAPDDWIPATLIGHWTDQESIKDRYDLYAKWFGGNWYKSIY